MAVHSILVSAFWGLVSFGVRLMMVGGLLAAVDGVVAAVGVWYVSTGITGDWDVGISGAVTVDAVVVGNVRSVSGTVV